MNQASNGKAERASRAQTQKRVSPFELLTGTAPDLWQIVFYGSQCYVYRDPRKNSLAQRSHIGTIIGISNETKGYKAWLRNEGKVIVTQHVKRIKTMTETQNAQLQCAIDSDDRAEAAEETAQEIDEHGTGGATKRAQAAVRQEEPEAGEDVVSAAFKRDPQNYAKAMRSTSETASRGGFLDREGHLRACCHVGVPAKHGDIPNAYVKAAKEAHLRIYLHLPLGMSVTSATLRKHGAAKARKSSLLRSGRACTGSSKPGGYGASFSAPRYRPQFFGAAKATFASIESETVRISSSSLECTTMTSLAAGTSAAAIYCFFGSLASLSIKDLGRASKFIGMRVQLSDDGGYRLDWDEAIGGLPVEQRAYRTRYATLTPTVDDINAEQPSDAELVGSANAPPEPTVRAFQSLVATRQTHASHVLDWSLAKRIARYLKGTATLKLTMKPSRDDMQRCDMTRSVTRLCGR
uniref:Retroviral polymerase SH3-like domain-containing protein n=1 Tax=Peronospora matthiolae TaxID=2874970 RepID=A0AAV1U5R0_9STRA